MSIQENKLFIGRYFDTFNQGSGTAVAEIVADSHLKEHIAFFEADFPGYQLTAKEMVAEGDKVVVDATLQGVHKGELMGHPPPANRWTFPLSSFTSSPVARSSTIIWWPTR